MRIVTFSRDGRRRCGFQEGDRVHETDWHLRDLLVLAATGQDSAMALEPVATHALADVGPLLPPLVPGMRLFCVGINYREHQLESSDVFLQNIPEAPVIFLKSEQALTGAGAALRLDRRVSRQYDWEGELGVVIGAPARAVNPGEAWHAIAGYTVVNDITARDLQVRHVQWCLGKNSESATPVGPCVVTRSSLPPNPTFGLSLAVNGVLKQSASTDQLIFDVPSVIAAISAVTPLLPGDIIATGTPSGVGFKREPPQFLADGDEIEVTISDVGTLVNRVVAPA